MLLGAIADDFTGASDLGAILADGGMRTIQYVGTPSEAADPNVAAGIVALKTRTMKRQAAVSQSLAALDWLIEQGCRQFYFKYCSTFDSTPRGNIGPVIESLVEKLQTNDPVIVCPAFPAMGRTIYQGYLFVGDRLLSESGMENHPLTPMTDPSIIRWLGHQSSVQIGHIGLNSVRGDARGALLRERDNGRQIVVADAIDDSDLMKLGKAASEFALLTGGSGLALALPENHGASGAPCSWRGEPGRALALAGSCSTATRIQIARHIENGAPARKITVEEALSGDTAATLLQWAMARRGLPLLYTSDDPAEVGRNQSKYGTDTVSGAIDSLMATLAAMAVQSGIRRLIIAGGETAGAVVGALDTHALEIGPCIETGVPALRVAGRPLVMALKSGNFGSENFFAIANNVLEGK